MKIQPCPYGLAGVIGVQADLVGKGGNDGEAAAMGAERLGHAENDYAWLSVTDLNEN